MTETFTRQTYPLDPHQERYLRRVGHVFFLVMLAGCAFFAPERMLNCDASYYSFHVINYGTPFIIHDRYANYLLQYPVLWAIDMGADLRTALTVYSMMGFVWFYALYCVLVHGMKTTLGGIFLILALCLSMRYKHYAGHTEITVALAVSSFLFVWLWGYARHRRHSLLHFGGVLLLCLWLYFIHPVVIIPLGMVLLADMLYHQRWKEVRHWMSLSIVGLTFFIKFFREVISNTYESGKVSALADFQNVFLNPSEYKGIYSVMGHYLTIEYIFLLPLFIFSLILLFKARHRLLASYFALCFLFLILFNLVLHTYLGGHVYFMIDGYLGMLGMPVGLCLIYAISHSRFNIRIHHILMVVILVSTLQIGSKSRFYRKRLKMIEKTFEMNEGHAKLYVKLDRYHWEKMWYPYEIPSDALIYTSLKGKEHAKTIYVDSDGRYSDTDTLDGFRYFEGVKPLNPKFFKLPDEEYHRTDKVGWKE